MSNGITVFTAPGCVVCKAVMRKMDKDGVAYDVQQLADHPDVQAEAKEMGFSSLPVMTIEADGSRELLAGPTSCSERLKGLASVH